MKFFPSGWAGMVLEQRVRSEKGISLQWAFRIEIDHYNRRPSSVFGFRWFPRQVHDNAPDSASVWRNDRCVKQLLQCRPVETPQHRLHGIFGKRKSQDGADGHR